MNRLRLLLTHSHNPRTCTYCALLIAALVLCWGVSAWATSDDYIEMQTTTDVPTVYAFDLPVGESSIVTWDGESITLPYGDDVLTLTPDFGDHVDVEKLQERIKKLEKQVLELQERVCTLEEGERKEWELLWEPMPWEPTPWWEGNAFNIFTIDPDHGI